MVVARIQLALGATLLLSGCSALERYDEDQGAAAAVLERRASPAPDMGRADDGSLDPRALELLAAPLSEEAAVRVALLNNREMRAAFAELGVAAAEAAQAGLVANPSLGVETKFQSSGTEIELSLVQPLLSAMLLPLRRDLADLQYEAAKAAVARRLIALVHDVRRGLVSVRASERLLELAREELVAAEAAHDLMAELHRAGNVTDPRLSAERVNLSRARLDLDAAELALVEAREPLNVLLGLWGSAVAWSVVDELGDDPLEGLALEDVEARAVAASLELAENRAVAEAHAREAGVVAWERWLPDAALGAAAQREADSGEWGVGPALELDLPLWDTGSARRQAQLRSLQGALAVRVALAVEVRARARLYSARLLGLSARTRYLREQHLPAHGLLVRHSLRDYNAMQVGVFEVLAMRRLELEAAREYVRTLEATWHARIDLEELLEGRLTDRRAAASYEPGAPDTGSTRPGAHP